jgi:plasmid maintenance system antidote protein VapI
MRPHKFDKPMLADALRAAVRATGLPVNAVARAAGVPQPVLYRFMTGERDLTLRTAEKLAAHLGLTLQPEPRRE